MQDPLNEQHDAPIDCEPAAVVSADQLFRDHADYVTAFLRRLGVTQDAVDDAVQDVFVVVHVRGGYRPGAASQRTWLGAIAVRVAANARRKRAREWKVDGNTSLESLASSDAPDRGAEQRQALAHVDLRLSDMSKVHREVFVLFTVGYSCNDIALAMDVPTGTVYSRLHAARQIFSATSPALVEAA